MGSPNPNVGDSSLLAFPPPLPPSLYLPAHTHTHIDTQKLHRLTHPQTHTHRNIQTHIPHPQPRRQPHTTPRCAQGDSTSTVSANILHVSDAQSMSPVLSAALLSRFVLTTAFQGHGAHLILQTEPQRTRYHSWQAAQEGC